MCDQTWLEISFRMACNNWDRWQDDYESPDGFENLPVLNCPERFRTFWKEYKVLQGVAGQKRNCVQKVEPERDWVRIGLCEPHASIDRINAGDAKGVDCLVEELAAFLAEAEERNCRQTAMISKLAAFARPHEFIAMDKWALKGVGRAKDDSYQAYMGAVNTVFAGELGQAIQSYADIQKHPGDNAAFSRRMLDVYLMLKGGRWPNLCKWAQKSH